MKTIAKMRHSLEAGVTVVALIGGIVLTGVAVFTVGAVIGDVFGAPVLGDSEVVELVVGVSVASFLPLCQMKNGHIAITLFTDPLPRTLRGTLDTLAAVLMLAVAIMLTWRMGVGGFDAFARGRATMFLQLPLWWGFAASTIPCILWVVCAAFVLVERALGLAPEQTSDTDTEAA